MRLIFILTIFFSGQVDAQSIILDLLYGQSKNIVKAKVEKIKYEESDADGSSFTVYLNVQKFYKGKDEYKKVLFFADKGDIIDLELDTSVMDYSFQIAKDSSYIFFMNRISRVKNPAYKSHGSGLTRLIEGEIEGIPFSRDIEEKIESYDRHLIVTAKDLSNPPPNFIFDVMKKNSTSIFLGKVLKIKEKKNIFYSLKVSTKTGNRTVITKNTNCICKEGNLIIGNYYVFYTNKDERNTYRPTDEYLSIIEASEYDMVKFNK